MRPDLQDRLIELDSRTRRSIAIGGSVLVLLILAGAVVISL